MDNARYLSKSGRTRGLLSLLFFFPSSCFLAIYTLFRFFVNCCSNHDLRFTIDDRSVRGTFLFFYRFNFFFFFLFSSISFIQKEEDRSVGFFSRGDLDDERTRSINRGGTRRSDRTICQRFVALSNQKICLPSWLHVYGASTVCRHCIENDPGISLKEDF